MKYMLQDVFPYYCTRVVFPAIYQDIEVINENMFALSAYTGKHPLDYQMSYVDMNGTPLFPQQCGRGFCNVSVPDQQGISIVSVASYQQISDLSRGYVTINGKNYERVVRYGVIDGQGGYLLEPAYKYITEKDGVFECTPFDDLSDAERFTFA